MKSFKVIQRVISMLIAIALIVSTMPVVAGESSDATSGVTGECLWSFDGATLTISGNGDMADYTSVNSPPWDIYKDSIHYITIEDGVSHIGEYAFEDCFEVFEVTIPGSVKSIGAGAFLCCTSLDYVNLPDGIVTIGGSAFKMCYLYSVRIPASVTNIGGGAFSLNFNFTGFTIDEENTVYSNDDYGALLNKDKTTLISVPCSVLEDRYTSNPLTEYTVPNGVTHIAYEAFYSCYELTSVTLPSSVETVASEAFTDCSRLNTVYYAGDESQRENIDFSGSNRYLVNATWHYNSCINKAEHDYTNNCDEECNTCSMKRVISHSFSDAQDTQCDVCDHTRVLESIAITSYPDKLSYTELADNLDTTGGEITLYYNDNTSGVIEITSDMVSGFDNSIVGKQLLTITYDDKTCEYEVTIIKATDYFVTFCNWDNTVISTEVYHRGDKVAIPEDPTKPSDNIYNYTFAGWDKEVVDCEGDATYTATYIAEYIDYTVTFKNWDETVLSTKTYHYGDVVTEPATPTRAKDKVYTYTFDSWDKEIVDCVENATYTATYTAEYIDYTVTFKNWDGTVLSTKSYHYGDEVTEPDAPTRAKDKVYTYTFDRWDNEVVNCEGDATYIAFYTTEYIDYTVTFKDWDGTVLSTKSYHYGDKVTVPDSPSKTKDKVYYYNFDGWDKDITNCEGDTTYTATYTVEYIDYTVTFKNWDGTVLSSKTYHYGDKVTVPNNPTRAKDKVYYYTFDSWYKAVVDCEGDATYTATYIAEYIDYTVTFKNWDGTVLSTKSYHYGDEVIEPDAPTKEADDTYTYIFNGWNNPVTECTGDATYTAKYKSIPNDAYTITYHLDGGTNALKNPDMYTAEDAITLMDATKTGYNFAGWFLDPDKTKQITKISNKHGNIDVYAKFIPKLYSTTFNGNGADECGYKVTLINDKTGEERYVYLNNGDSFSPHEYWKPSASGYVYAGWMCESQVLSGTLKINSDIVLVPKWIDNPNNYPVIGDGSLGSAASIYYPWRTSDKERFFTSYEYETYLYSYCVQKYIGPIDGNLNGGVCSSSSCEIGKVNGFIIASYNASSYNGESSGCYSKSGSGSFTATAGELLFICVRSWGDLELYNLNNVYIRVTPGNKRADIGKIEVDNTIEFDSYINAPSVSKTGYKFLGWYDSQGNQMTDTWQYTEDQTLTAKWELLSYDIIYELDGGINNLSNPTVYTTEDTITLKDPTKPGYTFEGWYSDADFTTRITSISKKSGNITLYAKFEVNSYNLKVDANHGGFAPKVTFISDGTVIKTSYLFEEDSITAYRPENKDGYIFAGWYKDESFSSLFKFNGTIKSDITLYAKWVECDSNTIDIEALEKFDVVIFGKTEQLYAFVPVADGKITVTSESDDLDLIGNLYDSSKQVLVSSDDISNTDLDFSYSYDVKAGQLYYIAVKGNTSLTSGDAAINIKWTGECTLKGTTYTSEQTSVVYDTNYKLPEKPIREGYVFLGWFDENNTKVTSGLWKFSTDKTLTAKWEQTTYHTVTFKNLEGEIISSDTYYISEDIVAPELPVKAPDETYTYSAKWDNNYTGVCTGDAVYSPIFEPTYIDYTVTFVDEDGKELSKKTYHWGDKIIEPDAPAKASDNIYSYTFWGWDKEVIDCAGDVTYTATYTPKYIDYTVVFKDWDGAVISSETYHWGDEITEPDAPTRPDDENYIYNFVEWDKKVINCEGDETYTAIYDKTAIVVTSIVITSQPDKLVYLEDEDFEKTGMVVVAYYNNDTNEIITDYTISGYDNTVGTKTITVAYGDQTATLTVEVTHNYEWIVDQENNCGVDGIKHEECSVCHSKQNEDTIIPATGEHTYSDAEDIECDVCKYLKAQIGDVDGDGNITIMDATMIQMHIAQLISIGEDRIVCADTDKDGTITIMDATMIQMFIAQLIPEL